MRPTHSVHEHVNPFAIAIAAIVSLLALASPSQAKVVYHSADITIAQGTYNLNLNSDGVTDFTITSESSGNCYSPLGGYGVLFETPASGNGAILGPLTTGDEIGPDQVFSGEKSYLAGYISGNDHNPHHPRCFTQWGGPWYSLKGTTGYLGLSFQLNGETHYGWAQLSVAGITATLTGYAYETIPGTAIKAGTKKGK